MQLQLKQIDNTNRKMSRYMDYADNINMEWHGSTNGNLLGGKIQEDIDGLHKEYDIPKNYETKFFSKKGITEEGKNLYYFLRARALAMYEGAQKCEEEIVKYSSCILDII